MESGKLKGLEKRLGKIAFYGVIIFLVGSVLTQFNSVSVKVMSNSYGYYLLYLFNAALMICGVMGISLGIKHGAVFAYMGKHSLVILMFHKFLILFIETLFSGTKQLIYSGHWSSLLLAFVISGTGIGCCLIFGKMLTLLRSWIYRKNI